MAPHEVICCDKGSIACINYKNYTTMRNKFFYLVALFTLFATASVSAMDISEPQSPNSKTYAIGDFYNDGVKQGYVFEVTPDGKHGKIYRRKNLGEHDWFDAVEMCSELGNGWRLPTLNELISIGYKGYDFDYSFKIDEFYWTSDVCDIDDIEECIVWTVEFKASTAKAEPEYKHGLCYVHPVANF